RAPVRADAGGPEQPEGEDRVPRLWDVAFRDRRKPRSAARGNERRDVVLQIARVSVQRRTRRFHRRARTRLCDRAEPRRAALTVDEAGTDAGSPEETAQRAAL